MQMHICCGLKEHTHLWGYQMKPAHISLDINKCIWWWTHSLRLDGSCDLLFQEHQTVYMYILLLTFEFEKDGATWRLRNKNNGIKDNGGRNESVNAQMCTDCFLNSSTSTLHAYVSKLKTMKPAWVMLWFTCTLTATTVSVCLKVAPKWIYFSTHLNKRANEYINCIVTVFNGSKTAGWIIICQTIWCGS